MLKAALPQHTATVFFSTIFLVVCPSVVLAQASPEASVYLDRAVLAYGAKRFDEALKELEEAIRLNPESVEVLYYQGLVYGAQNKISDARIALEKALKLRPNNINIAFQLGVLYFIQKEYGRAEPLFQEVHGTKPSRPNLGYYLGLIKYRKKDYRAAIKYFRATVPSNDNFAQLARFYSGLAMSALDFPREARREIEEALRLQPVSPLSLASRKFGKVLEKAEERKRFFHGELRLGVFYDTNVPVVPSADSDLVARTIRRQQKRRESEGESVSLNFSYTFLRTLDWEGTVSHRFFQTYNNHLTEFNTQSHTPTVGIVNRGSISSPFGDQAYFAGLQYTYDFITLGNSRFTQRWIVGPYVTLVENPWNLTNLQFQLQVKDFFNDRDVVRREVRDASQFMVGALHFFLFDQGRHYIKVGYQYDFNDAEGKNWTYWGNRALVGLQYMHPWWNIQFRYDLNLHWRFHKSEHSLIPATAPGTKKRRDREGTHSVSIAKDFDYGNRKFTFSVDYLFDINKSNLAPFDYRRHVVTTSLAWRF